MPSTENILDISPRVQHYCVHHHYVSQIPSRPFLLADLAYVAKIIAQWADFSNKCNMIQEMEFDGGDDGEHSGVDVVEITQIF